MTAECLQLLAVTRACTAACVLTTPAVASQAGGRRGYSAGVGGSR